MKRILLFIFLAMSASGYAQFKGYSFHLSTNYTAIDAVRYEPTVTPSPSNTGYYSQIIGLGTVKESFKGQTGFGLSSKLDYKISTRFFITSGLSVNYMRYQRSVKIESLDAYSPTSFIPPPTTVSGAPFGSYYYRTYDNSLNPTVTPFVIEGSEKAGKTTTFYLQIPLMAGTTFLKEKLVVRSGFTFSCLLNATQYRQQYSFNEGITTEKINSTKGFNSFMVGAALETTYLITKQLGVDLAVQRSLSSIYDKSSAAKPKYNIFSLGVSYSFTR
jgi:hypothetical protein